MGASRVLRLEEVNKNDRELRNEMMISRNGAAANALAEAALGQWQGDAAALGLLGEEDRRKGT